MFLQLIFHCLEPAVTSHTWDQQLPVALLRYGKISSGKIDGELFIRTMGRTGAAAGPILKLTRLDIQKAQYASNRIVIFPGSPMERASRVIGNLFHVLAPFSKALKISLTSFFPPQNFDGSSLIFPLRYIFHPKAASLKKSFVLDLNWRMRLSS